ncbi:protein DpdG [Streptomyces sp. NPDC017248]|uniref:protein DpdG n=1 Tax=unclassified Streptomyces TaxID=2593676 RepID=UPI0037B388C4
MTLLNVSAALPSQAWAVVRLLAYLEEAVPLEEARSLLSPPSIRGEKTQDKPPFDKAISTLEELGLIRAEGGDQQLSLAGPATSLDGQDVSAFAGVLRHAALDPARNTSLGDSPDQTGPRDLTRALAWLLTFDPTVPMDWRRVQNEQRDALRPEAGPVFSNPTRWLRFNYWAPTLGLAAAPLFQIEDGNANRLVPDCTIAVRQTLAELQQIDVRMNAVEVLRILRERIPVLPGGAHSRAVGLRSPGDTEAGAALSFALLRGEDEKWLRLEHEDDAQHVLQVHDPDRSSARPVSAITILEAVNG